MMTSYHGTSLKEWADRYIGVEMTTPYFETGIIASWHKCKRGRGVWFVLESGSQIHRNPARKVINP